MDTKTERQDMTNVEKRRDEALRRALSTPPKPKQESAKRKEPDQKKGKPAKKAG